MPIHSIRFPDESPAYRAARDELLRAEQDLARRVWDVAAMRKKLPPGGAVPADYAFEEGAADLFADAPARRVKLSELFPAGKDTLVLYSFMYGPDMEQPCPMCSSLLDGLNGTAVHAAQRVGFAVVAKSPIARVRAWARERAWRNLRLLSSAGTTYNSDYHGEDAQGDQLPALNVFVRRDGRVQHFYNAEMLYAPAAEGAEACHVDLLWPLWNLLDLTPEGRGEDWYPALTY
jgi:predicted dithiol-disulfide oxidoreductase (DUF899 family)